MKGKQHLEKHPLAEWIADLIQTRECQEVLVTVAQEILESWSGDRPVKSRISRLIGSRLEKRLGRQGSSTGKSIGDLLADRFTQTDFGELKETIENSREGLNARVSSINDQLWNYPAKLVILLSFAPFVINLLSDSLRETVGRFNETPPDLVADILKEVLQEIEPETLAELVNTITELVRKIHTGSALIGDPGSPALPRVTGEFVERFCTALNWSTLHKSGLALAKEKASLEISLAEAIAAQPGLVAARSSHKATVSAVRLRSLNRKLEKLEALAEEDFQQGLDSFLRDLDLQELSETVNLLAGLAHRVQQSDSQQLAKSADQLIQQLDLSQIEDLLAELPSESKAALKSIGRAVVPNLVIGVCQVLTPEDDEFEATAARARKALRSLLVAEEVDS